MNMHTTIVTFLTSGGGLPRPFRTAISAFVIQLTASSAALRAGMASASFVSQSILIALASSAIFYASASSTATEAFTFSAASDSLVTMISYSSVSLPVSTRIGYKSSSSFCMTLTLLSVPIKQS